jgi:hypothetical protein
LTPELYRRHIELPTGAVRLSSCHGFAVSAGPRGIGSLETPLFAGPGVEPDYLLVRTGEEIAGTFRVVPAALVVDVDPVRRVVVLDADAEAVAALPQHLPRNP